MATISTNVSGKQLLEESCNARGRMNFKMYHLVGFCRLSHICIIPLCVCVHVCVRACVCACVRARSSIIIVHS